MFEITVGADPEVFVVKKGDAYVSPACGLIPGSKDRPHKVDGGAVQVDGLALEFNIDPAHTRAEFVGNVVRVYDTLKSMVPEYSLITKCHTAFAPAIYDKLPSSSKVLGCDPDMNAYTMAPNPVPNSSVVGRSRAIGGHIHIGWTSGENVDDPQHIYNCCRLVRQLDWYLGLYSLIWDYGDHTMRRRAFYGRAGSFRAKPYGLEYRVLSSMWLNTEQLMGWVYDATRVAVDDFANDLFAEEIAGKKYGGWSPTYPINNGTRSWANEIGDLDPMNLFKRIGHPVQDKV